MQENFTLPDGTAGTTNVIDSGPEGVKLVIATTPKATAACGLVDIDVYDRFEFAAIKAAHKDGGLIGSQKDMLEAKVVKANKTAEKLGANTDMDVATALELLNS